jgi:hypothetical protein
MLLSLFILIYDPCHCAYQNKQIPQILNPKPLQKAGILPAQNLSNVMIFWFCKMSCVYIATVEGQTFQPIDMDDDTCMTTRIWFMNVIMFMSKLRIVAIENYSGNINHACWKYPWLWITPYSSHCKELETYLIVHVREIIQGHCINQINSIATMQLTFSHHYIIVSD